MKNIDVKPDPEVSAKEAHLRYLLDTEAGITRKKDGKHYKYHDKSGEIIKDEKTIQRIRSLGIPPAWTKVWISPISYGHLQATGRDSRDRKQYRYHVRWRAIRDETKYDRMIEFSQALPKLRKITNKDLLLNGMPKEKVVATIVQLLEKTLIRVGNDEYAKENDSFGLTTMRDKHVKFNKSEAVFEFKGKSNVKHKISLEDKKLIKIVKRCKEIPGFELFQYIDDEGNHHTIDSADVNEYIKDATGEDFTAKDFRTWAGTVLAAKALQEFTKFDSEAQAKRNVVEAIEGVAKQLGNTKAICRKCYVHPEIINAYLDGSLVKNLSSKLEDTLSNSINKLKPEEAAVVAFLEKRLNEKKREF